MGKEVVYVVLAEEKHIAGIIRNPGYVLLEGVCPENVTGGDIDKAIQLGQVKVVIVEKKIQLAHDKKSEGSDK